MLLHKMPYQVVVVVAEVERESPASIRITLSLTVRRFQQ